MKMVYNLFAGQQLERLAALSDGVFAIAMTLLVLDLHIPDGKTIHTENDLFLALIALFPRLITYLMSFLTLGIFWVGQQTQINHFVRSDRNLTWIHLGFLLAVSMTPFSTSLLAGFFTYHIALVVNWFNVLLLGIALYTSRRYAWRAGLVKEDVTVEVWKAAEGRIVLAQALYALGALLCVIHTYVSIAFIVLLQLNYVIGPRIHWHDMLGLGKISQYPQWLSKALRHKLGARTGRLLKKSLSQE